MVSSLSVGPAKDYNDLRSNMYKVEGRIIGFDAVRAGRVADEIEKVALMKLSFDEFRLYARRGCTVSNFHMMS